MGEVKVKKGKSARWCLKCLKRSLARENLLKARAYSARRTEEIFRSTINRRTIVSVNS